MDISILRLSRGVFEVLATVGDTALGGDDFDQALAEWVLQQARISELDFLVAAACWMCAERQKKPCRTPPLFQSLLQIGPVLLRASSTTH